ncbi:MAG: TIGR04086 family membrane protein [Syntrophomonas sp.]
MRLALSVELKALGKAMLLSLLLCVISAALVYYTRISEMIFPTLGRIILAITAFYAACATSRVRGSKGLLRGVNMGAAVFILVFIATLALQPAAVGIKTFAYSFLICLVAGATGGIVGVGLYK